MGVAVLLVASGITVGAAAPASAAGPAYAITAQIPVPESVGTIAVDSSGHRAFAIGEFPEKVTDAPALTGQVIDTTTLTVVGSIRGGGVASGARMAIDEASDTAFTSSPDPFERDMTLVNTSPPAPSPSGERLYATGEWRLGANSVDVAVHPRGHAVFLASSDGRRIIKYGTLTKRVVQFGQGDFVEPTAVAADTQAGLLWVADRGDNRLKVLDADSNPDNPSLYERIPLTDTPNDLELDPTNDRVYVLGTGGTVTVIDTETYAVVATISGLQQPVGLAMDLTSRAVFVSQAAGSIAIIDGRTNQLVATVPVPGALTGPGAVDQGNRIFLVAVPSVTGTHAGAVIAIADTSSPTLPPGPIAQSIAFTSPLPVSPRKGGIHVVRAIGGGSRNPITFSVDALSSPGACKITATTPQSALVSFTNSGRCVIAADQAGNGAYSAAQRRTQSISVEPPVGPPPTTGGAVFGWGSAHAGQVAIPANLNTAVVAVSAGYNHSLALQTSGRVVAWGDNAYGQGTVPGTVPTATAIAAGSFHNLVLTPTGKVVAWGRNTRQQANVPAALNAQVVTAIAAGHEHSLALTDAGTVVAWGDNTFGQTTVPAALTGKRVVAVSAGEWHSLALTDTGQVFAWGNNQYGQGSVPSSLSGKKITAIAAGFLHNAALTIDGQVLAWGDPTAGKTTVPTTLRRSVTRIAAGQSHTLALTRNGDVIAWGDGTAGQTEVPESFAGRPITTLSAGGFHSLAIGPSDALPGVASQPQDLTVNEGDIAAFAAVADGIPRPTVQWQKAAFGSTTFVDIPDATGAVFIVPATTVFDDRVQYRAVFTNSSGSRASADAMLTVVPQGMPSTRRAPGAPSITSVEGSDGTATVTFAPGTPGNPGSRSFLVTATSPTAPTRTVQRAVSPVTVGGLTNGASYTFTVTADNGVTPNGVSAPVGPVVIGVMPAITGAPETLEAVVGTPFSYRYTASGAPAPTFSTPSEMPDGLTLAGDGTISGTPTTAGSYFILVSAQNALGGGVVFQSMSITDPIVGGPGDGPPAVLTVDPPSATVAAGTPQPFTVTATDAAGNDLGDITADTQFTIAPATGGGGSADGASCTGSACVALKSGAYTVTATSGSATASVALTVVPGPAATATIVDGNSQAATPNARFPRPFTVRVADGYGNPVPGIPVSFRVLTAGVATIVGDDAPLADASGLASVRVKAGPTPGPVTVIARAGSAAATFLVTVNASTTARADLSVAVSGTGTASSRSAITYTVTVTNNGPTTAVKVLTALLVPPRAGRITATPGTTPIGGTTTFAAPSLSPGEKATYRVTVKVGSAKGAFTVVATTLSATKDPRLSNNVATTTLTVR